MIQPFFVWRLSHGYGDAKTFEAYDHEEAAGRAHNGDFENGDEEVFCVQAARGDRKVRVIASAREMVPSYHGTELTAEKLKARCACGARLFDSDGHGNQCRRCWLRANSEQIEMWIEERAR